MRLSRRCSAISSTPRAISLRVPFPPHREPPFRAAAFLNPPPQFGPSQGFYLTPLHSPPTPSLSSPQCNPAPSPWSAGARFTHPLLFHNPRLLLVYYVRHVCFVLFSQLALFRACWVQTTFSLLFAPIFSPMLFLRNLTEVIAFYSLFCTLLARPLYQDDNLSHE